jgi:cysteinyl-tRNA synthetase
MKTVKLLFLAAVLVWSSCGNDENDGDVYYKQEMRTFVQNLSYYAKGFNAGFIIIPQNGQELVTDNGDTDGNPVTSYLNSIDGAGREDLFFGYDDDDVATPKTEKDYMLVFLDVCEENDVEVLVTDYCFSHEKMDESYTKNNAKGYISFAAPERELNVVPDYPTDARNFLYLLNPENFGSKQDFISALSETNYDVIIMDCFFNEEEFTFSETETLKTKRNGGTRLVISYMSIGEAEDYRYYWQSAWKSTPPYWLAGENPDWAGNYKVRYWVNEWQNIIYGNESSYIYKIIMAGFDGVYLDIIDAFEYFE